MRAAARPTVSQAGGHAVVTATEESAEDAETGTHARIHRARWQLGLGEIDKHLLQRRLTCRVVLDPEFKLGGFQRAEELSELYGRIDDVEMEEALMNVFEDCARKCVLHELLDWLDDRPTVLIHGRYFDYHRVSFAEFALEMLRTAETFELPVDHNGDLRAQGVTFLHAIKLFNGDRMSVTLLVNLYNSPFIYYYIFIVILFTFLLYHPPMK